MNCVKCNGRTVPMYPVSKVREEYICGNCIDKSVIAHADRYEQMVREHDAARRPSRIYVASSWRNPLQAGIVVILRGLGHDVYDFKNPSPGNTGFNWREIDPNWQDWTPEQYREALKHPIAEAGYKSDITALRACDAVVYVLPCGRSASWEFGYAMGQGKKGYVVALDRCAMRHRPTNTRRGRAQTSGTDHRQREGTTRRKMQTLRRGYNACASCADERGP